LVGDMQPGARPGFERLPGGGVLFALRAIGIVLLARWMVSMSEVGFFQVMEAMASSPWACVHAVFIFLLLVLPGARPRADRPYHPMPQWLRRTLRVLACLGLIVVLASLVVFAVREGPAQVLDAVGNTNGWLAVVPLLYLAIFWLCRPRALLSTHPAARRYAIGPYAIAIDPAAGVATVWDESHRIGRYAVTELAVRRVGDARGRGARRLLRWRAPRPRVELLWRAPAAVGQHRRPVFRVTLRTVGDERGALALEAALNPSRLGPVCP
jgi:hypothetical protein